MLAPVLAFTADEAWGFIPGRPADSVHLAEWKPAAFAIDPAGHAQWKNLLILREQVLPELEKARQAKTIGKALEAKVTLSGTMPALAEAAPLTESLRELLNVSQLVIQPGGEGAFNVVVARADGGKCERCWHWETSTGGNTTHPTLCARCVDAVTA
jgi:isoleucyl-tRNA synthetase